MAASPAPSHALTTPGSTAVTAANANDLFYQDIPELDIGSSDAVLSTPSSSHQHHSRNASRTSTNTKNCPSTSNSPLLSPYVGYDDRRGAVLSQRRSPYFGATFASPPPPPSSTSQRKGRHAPSASASAHITSYAINNPLDPAGPSSSSLVSPTLRPVLRYSRRAYSTNVHIPPLLPLSHSSSHHHHGHSNHKHNGGGTPSLVETHSHRKSAPTSVNSSPLLEPIHAPHSGHHHTHNHHAHHHHVHAATQPPTPLALDPEYQSQLHPSNLSNHDTTSSSNFGYDIDGNTIKSRKKKQRQSLPLSFAGLELGLGGGIHGPIHPINGVNGIGGYISGAGATGAGTTTSIDARLAGGAGSAPRTDGTSTAENNLERDESEMNHTATNGVATANSRSFVMSLARHPAPQNQNGTHVVTPSAILQARGVDADSPYLNPNLNPNRNFDSYSHVGTGGASKMGRNVPLPATSSSGSGSAGSRVLPWNLDTQLDNGAGAGDRGVGGRAPGPGIRSAAPGLGRRRASRLGFSSAEHSEHSEAGDEEGEKEEGEEGGQLRSGGTIKRPSRRLLDLNGNVLSSGSSGSHSHSGDPSAQPASTHSHHHGHRPKTLSSRRSKLEGLSARRDKHLGSLISPSAAVRPVETRRAVSSTSASQSQSASASVSEDEEYGRVTRRVVTAPSVPSSSTTTGGGGGRGRSPRRSTSVSTTARLSNVRSQTRPRAGGVGETIGEDMYAPTFSSSSKSTSRSRSPLPAPSASATGPAPVRVQAAQMQAQEGPMRASFDTIVGATGNDRLPRRQDTIVGTQHAHGRKASTNTLLSSSTSPSTHPSSSSFHSPSASGEEGEGSRAVSPESSNADLELDDLDGLELELSEVDEKRGMGFGGKAAEPMRMRNAMGQMRERGREDIARERGRDGSDEGDEEGDEREERGRGRAKERRGRSLVR